MKTKNRTFKIITLLTLSILMLAIMAIFPLVNNASAEEEINTTDKFIIQDIDVGVDLSGKYLFIDNTKMIEANFAPTALYVSANYEIYWNYDNGEIYYVDVVNWTETSIYVDNEEIPFEYFILPADFGLVTENLDTYDIISYGVLNPDYIEPEPTPEPTEEPENPINEITDFFSNASVAAIILLVLGSYVVYSIIKK